MQAGIGNTVAQVLGVGDRLAITAMFQEKSVRQIKKKGKFSGLLTDVQVYEVLDNCVDEVQGGHADKITVSLQLYTGSLYCAHFCLHPLNKQYCSLSGYWKRFCYALFLRPSDVKLLQDGIK